MIKAILYSIPLSLILAASAFAGEFKPQGEEIGSHGFMAEGGTFIVTGGSCQEMWDEPFSEKVCYGSPAYILDHDYSALYGVRVADDEMDSDQAACSTRQQQIIDLVQTKYASLIQRTVTTISKPVILDNRSEGVVNERRFLWEDWKNYEEASTQEDLKTGNPVVQVFALLGKQGCQLESQDLLEKRLQNIETSARPKTGSRR